MDKTKKIIALIIIIAAILIFVEDHYLSPMSETEAESSQTAGVSDQNTPPGRANNTGNREVREPNTMQEPSNVPEPNEAGEPKDTNSVDTSNAPTNSEPPSEPEEPKEVEDPNDPLVAVNINAELPLL